MAKCLWWLPFCQIFRNIFGVETYECALAEKNRYETGDFDKNRYKFYMKFILLVDTWHIIFFLIIALGLNFPNIYGVHTVESLEMLYFLAWNIAILL